MDFGVRPSLGPWTNHVSSLITPPSIPQPRAEDDVLGPRPFLAVRSPRSPRPEPISNPTTARRGRHVERRLPYPLKRARAEPRALGCGHDVSPACAAIHPPRQIPMFKLSVSFVVTCCRTEIARVPSMINYFTRHCLGAKAG